MKFRYQRFGLRVLLFAPFFLLLLVIADGLADYIQNPIAFNLLVALIVIVVMTLVFRVTEGMSQIRATGECRIDEKGRCFFAMNRKMIILNGVREISAWNKRVVGSRYVQLLVKSPDGRKVKIYGAPHGPGEPMYEDDLIKLHGYILSHYPELRQVQNMHGEPIDFWYKK